MSSSAKPTDSDSLGFSFAGGGWLMCYLFGVAKSLRHHGLHHTARFTGTSAGALTAIGLTLDADFDAINQTVVTSYVPQAHGSMTGPFQMRQYLVDALTRHANLHDFAKCNADPLKCTIVYTSLSAFEPRRKNTFTSESHLLQTLIASCCATPLVGLPFQFEGEWVIDGGLTENQPRFQSYHNVQRVVNVSPNVMDTSADIRPSQYVPPWWSMYPPSAVELEWVFALGQKDGHEWCIRHGFSQSPSSTLLIPERPVVEHKSLSQRLGLEGLKQTYQSVLNQFSLWWDLFSMLLLWLELIAQKASQVGTNSGLVFFAIAAALSTMLIPGHDMTTQGFLGGFYAYAGVSACYQLCLYAVPEWIHMTPSSDAA